MTIKQLVARARACVSLDAGYALGAGKTTPTGDDPLDENGNADCSAFVCWVLGLDKHQPLLAWLKRVNGGWYNTDGIWWDGLLERTGHFDQLEPAIKPEKAAVGSVLVYPSRALLQGRGYPVGPPSPRIGHVGIVTGDGLVTHCSAGNARVGGAIAETKLDVFIRGGAAAVWCASVEL